MNIHKNETHVPYFQHTLKESFTCVSRGLHTGLKIVMRVTPGEPNTGIVFVRRDIEANRSEIQANWQNVSDTRLSTTIANKRGIRVSTIEHLMAALYSCGIDNARILVDGPEVPIMDGSAAPFVQLINQAGKVQQDAERNALLIKQSISLTRGEKFAGFQPSPVPWMELEIDFDASPIGNQKFSVPIYRDIFEQDLAAARTFGFKDQVSTLHKLGLAQGGSLHNTILIDQDEIVNNDGLRFDNEFVRHKMVDTIGDLALVGVKVIGHFTGIRNGHELNNALIQKLMANEHAWVYTTLRQANHYWKQIMQLPNGDKNLAKKFMAKMDQYLN